MKNKQFINCIVFVLSLLILSATFSGCSKKSAQSEPPKESSNEKKAPDTLKKLESGIDAIIENLDPKDNEADNQTQGDAKPQSSSETKTETKTEESKDQSKNETKQEVKNESPDDKKWKDTTTKIEETHKQWNELQPDLSKGGVQQKVLDDFSNTLNTLTTYITAKDLQNTLLYSNELYRFIADFMDPYNNKTPPESKRITYFIRNAKYSGMANQWEKAKSSITNLKSHWSILKPQIKKDQQDAADKMDVSILELEKVVAQSNMTLTKIKSDIALENVKALEQSFEKSQDVQGK